MRRLYVQIYVTFLVTLLLLGVLVSLAWWLIPVHDRAHNTMQGLQVLVGEALSADLPPDRLNAKVDRLAAQFNADVTVRAADGAVIAQAGRALPIPSDTAQSGWVRLRGMPPMLALKLDDGRWFLAHIEHRSRGTRLFVALLVLSVVVAASTYPIAKRITSRLERLQARVEALGAGDLQARVAVEGRDEVAKLAQSFNRAADRIERLLESQKQVLASASHELRSPLARMRMAAEMLPQDARPELRAQLLKDHAELDELIDELLLASRLDAAERTPHVEDVDVLALLAEEAARTGGQVSGEPVIVRGEARLLRRLVRNLLENAVRYAGGAAIEASVRRREPAGATLVVADRGPGVPAEERERIFQSFYRPPGASESATGGVGLGLALVRRIARYHRGDVKYIAREGGGSVFEVELHNIDPAKREV